ncbi:MAG: TatD family hydrolase [Alphaproteobacteria bacterium]
MLVDSHCHLDFPDFESELEAVIARARQADIGLMLTICTKISEFAHIRAIAEGHDDIFCTVGIHPHEAANEPEVDTARIVELTDHPKVVGIGETGLDYHYENSPRDRQQHVFRTHIDAARMSGLPLIVHCRDADEDMVSMLADAHREGPFTGLIHCFSASPEVAEKALKIGFYISFSGIVTFKNAEGVRDVARTVPLDRMLVETDAPYLAPVPKRGKRNEPAFVNHTATYLAELLGLAPADFYRLSSDNFFRLFSKVPAPSLRRSEAASASRRQPGVKTPCA